MIVEGVCKRRRRSGWLVVRPKKKTEKKKEKGMKVLCVGESPVTEQVSFPFPSFSSYSQSPCLGLLRIDAKFPYRKEGKE